MIPRPQRPPRKRWIAPGAGFVVFASVALIVWRWNDAICPWMIWPPIVTAIAAALWRYVALPRSDRLPARHAVLLAIGTSLFAVSVWTQRNVQIEGLFWGLLAGVAEGAIIHYLLGKVVGPLLFGRVWCGWACWIGALLDLLPYRRPAGRVQRWAWLRYVHFGLSLALVAALWFGSSYGLGLLGPVAVRWFLVGNSLYLISGVVLAVVLRDNPAQTIFALCPAQNQRRSEPLPN